ncbi:VanZ family protein [Paenibacillus hexagrammi]|uniref:VanZ family protein n=1 Tax=Paenibacillus hexagrammi TaxID=2908839 RepID=UPI0033130381
MKQGLLIFIVYTTILIWAVLDEFHQSFVPGRTPSVTDICVDYAGTVAFALLHIIYSVFCKRGGSTK